MPELKNLFIKGKMNKDLDERLLPQGEYRDAENVDVSYSEGSEAGTLQNILGNEKIGNISLTEASCIGSVRDTENDKIYWFIASPSKDLIVELSGSTVSPILVDTGSILNFSKQKDNYITGVNILDEVLYFTDNLNEPKQVDINYWKTKSNNNFDTTTSGLSEDRITVIKKSPKNAPTFNTIDSSVRGGNGTEGNDIVQVSLNLSNNSVGDTIGIFDLQYKAANGTTPIVPNWNVNDIVEFKNTFTDEFGNEQQAVARLKFITDNSESSSDQWELLTITSTVSESSVFYIGVLEEDEPLFELKFPRFAYRYKYTNGQFSTMSPFSLPAFIAGDYSYTAKEGFNTGMTNIVRKLLLDGWANEFAAAASGSPLTITMAINSYEADIDEIEILYKDSVGSNIYIVESLKKSGNTFPATFEVKDEQIYKVIESNQLLRPFDSVPKIAKSQEIVGNRLLYGNYKQNFNVTTNPSFTLSAASRASSNIIPDKFSLKSGRTYQVGIVYQDQYGRQTPVFTDTSGVIKIDSSKAELTLALSASVSQASLPSELTHYKYYIKEVSNPYYNIAASNIYEDNKTGHLYLSFPSSEVNKVAENNLLIFKKGAGETPYKLKNNKFKVLSKLSDPPNFLANKTKVVYATDYLLFDNSFADDAPIAAKAPGKTPVSGHNTILLEKAGRAQTDSTPNDVNDEFKSTIITGSKIRFRRTGTSLVSELYKIKSIVYSTDEASTEAEITFDTPFGNDVNVIYDNNTSTSTYQASIEKVETESDLGNPEYEGKFFIKLNADSQLKQGLLESADESNLGTVATHANINMTEQPSGQHDIREYFIAEKANSGVALGSFTAIAGHNATPQISSGYHVIFVTENDFDSATDQYRSDPFAAAIIKSNFLRFSHNPNNNYKIEEVQTGFLSGDNQKYFAVKFESFSYSTSFPTSGSITVDARAYVISGSSTFSNPPIFEIEPEDGLLDIYYETEKTYNISDLASTKALDYTNCISFGNGVESDRIRDDYNAPTLGKGTRVSTVFEDNYQQETLKTGLIYSGIYNGKNGINRLNQFITAEKITKDLNPEYGSIQLLHTRDTDIVAFCEDKLVKIFANKDAVFNADGNPNLIATNRVLGQAVIPPTFGAYGISKNPESFVDHTYRGYFTDRNKGKVLRLSIDGVTEISNYGMKDYFKDKLSSNTGLIIGTFDENKGQYNVTFSDYTVSFSESVNGWPSRKTFLPESGISLNNVYYTFKNGEIYKHSNNTRNTFYGGSLAPSTVTFYLNDSPGNVKIFRTLNYQGDNDWEVEEIKTNRQTGAISSFVNKEGIYYNYISGENQATKSSLDLKALNVQGLGTPVSISSNNITFTNLNSVLQIGDKVFNNSNDDIRTVQSISGNTVTLDAAPTNAFNYFAKDNRYNTSGLLGYYLEATLKNESNEAKELYSVGSEVSLSS
jgi:hypothetical protein